MPSRRPSRLAVRLIVLLAACVVSLQIGAAEPPIKPAGTPTPAFSIPLREIGYHPVTNAMSLRMGYTVLTVGFADNDHLLVTFAERKLLPRLPDQQETDDDHLVRAVLLHLPDGKVVREGEWRLHDRAQYLWPLANGRFLLRIRNRLYSVDPLRAKDGKGMGDRPLITMDGEIRDLDFSPGRDLILVETSPARHIGDDEDDRKKQRPVTGYFFSVENIADSSIALAERGRVEAKTPFSMAFTRRGLLKTAPEDRTHWGFDFETYGGKNMDLAGYLSTCKPGNAFTSESSFVSFGCRGGDDRRLLAGFNLLGEARWVFTTDDAPLWLSIVSAPVAGRFAIRNTLVTPGAVGDDHPDAENIRMQEVRVYGERNGDELLRVTTTPLQIAGGNFALSPDGMRLAAVHDVQLEIYTLPPLGKEDAALLERERQSIITLPEVGTIPMTTTTGDGAAKK